MPFVKPHTRRGKPVKGHFRRRSVWNFWFGALLLLLFLAVVTH